MGKSGGGGNTTTVQKSDPWEGVQPYLTGSTGIYPEASRIYSDIIGKGYVGQAPGQRDVVGKATSFFGSPTVSDTYTAGIGAGKEALTGGFDPTMGQVRDVQTPSNNPWLDQMFQGTINRSMRAFGDASADAGRLWSDQIAPSIRTGAQSAGQYGGSRQGVAEGIAASRLQDSLNRYGRDLATSAMDTGANMFGNAYQQQMQNQLQANLANANLDVTRNAQEMQRAGQSLQNRISGLGLTGSAISGAGTNYDQLYNLLGIDQAEKRAAQEYPLDILGRYASIVTPGAGLGGTSTNTSPLYQNKTSGMMGGALAGAQLGSMIFPGIGTAIGAIGGGLLGRG